MWINCIGGTMLLWDCCDIRYHPETRLNPIPRLTFLLFVQLSWMWLFCKMSKILNKGNGCDGRRIFYVIFVQTGSTFLFPVRVVSDTFKWIAATFADFNSIECSFLVQNTTNLLSLYFPENKPACSNVDEYIVWFVVNWTIRTTHWWNFNRDMSSWFSSAHWKL